MGVEFVDLKWNFEMEIGEPAGKNELGASTARTVRQVSVSSYLPLPCTAQGRSVSMLFVDGLKLTMLYSATDQASPQRDQFIIFPSSAYY